MSILAVKKATLIGLGEAKTALLDKLQTLGVLHIIPLSERSAHQQQAGVSSAKLKEVLAYLLASRRKRHQVLVERHFDFNRVMNAADRNRQQRLVLLERRDFLKKRIKDLTPWGSFDFPEQNGLYDQRMWFYLVPNYRMQELSKLELPWEVVHRDNRHTYLVVISPEEPAASLLPVLRTHTGAVSRQRLQRELEDAEIELEAVEAEREALTRWIYLLQCSYAGVENRNRQQQVAGQTLDKGEVFALQGWVAEKHCRELTAFAEAEGMVLNLQSVSAQDQPPTLLENAPAVAGGEEVVHFFQMPGYRSWDPSRVVFFSFVCFFALIMSDAGYSLLLAALLALYWNQLGQSESKRRLRTMGVALSVAGAIWGVLVGSYFGAPPPAAWLEPLKLFDLQDFNSMMRLSIAIGGAHLILANLVMAWVKRSQPTAWSSVGWVLVLAAALWAGLAGSFQLANWLLLGAGMVLVLGFSSTEKSWKRWLGGVLALTQITQLLGDLLSYLRLFALGLASASLAMTFNQLAGDVASALPAIGLLFKVLILLVGHLLNFALTVVSGVIHGLRLNLIEFYNWSLADEGYPFEPFAKREVIPWIT